MPLDPRCARVLAMLRAGPGAAQDLASRRRSLIELARVAGASLPAGLAVNDLAIAEEHGALMARRYDPRRSPEQASAAIVYLHGGGWVAGGLSTHEGVCATLAISSGAQVFAVDYRLAPEHPFPAALADAGGALRWVAAHAEALGVDRTRLVIAGDSAGANIAAAVAAAEGGPPIARQLLICPILDPGGAHSSRVLYGEGHFIDRAAFAADLADYLAGGDVQDARVSPLRSEQMSRLPPADVHVAEFDPFRDEGSAYAAKLTAAGVDVRVTLHPGMIHYFYALPRLIPRAGPALETMGRDLAAALAPMVAARATQALHPDRRSR